jgi:glycosyltransferase involved in cell wall biosynthesis
MTKKVIFLITKGTFGGAQRYVYDLATHLPREQFEPIVVCGSEGKLTKEAQTASIRTIVLNSLGRNISVRGDVKSFFAIRSLLRRERPAVLHLNSSKAALLGALASLSLPRIERKEMRVVFTAHGWPFKEPRGLIFRSIAFLGSALTAFCADHIITLSREDTAYASSLFCSRKTHYIPLGISPVAYLPPAAGFEAAFPNQTPPRLSTQTIRILSIAELTPTKGLDRGVAAVALLAERGIDCVWCIVGEGEERVKLQSLVKRYGLTDRIFFPGFIPDAAQLIRGFDVFLLPSRKEGAPYVLIEAYGAGIPIVTSEAVREAAEDFGATIVAHEDTEALAEALTRSGTRPHAGGQFRSLKNMVEETLPLYV